MSFPQPSEHSFRAFFEGSPGLYVVLDPEFHVVALSDPYARAVRLARAEMLGRSLFEIFPNNPGVPNGNTMVKLRESLERVRLTKAPDQMKVQKYDLPKETGEGSDEKYWSPKNIPLLNAAGELTHILHCVEDVTDYVLLQIADRRQAETLELSQLRTREMGSEIFLRSQELFQTQESLKKAEDSERRLRALADSIPQLVWMSRPDGVVLWYNRRWFEYTGTTQEEMDHGGLVHVHDPVYLPKVAARWKEATEKGEPTEMEFPLRRHDGQFRWFLTRVVPMRDDSGKIVSWFGTNTDIDDQKKAAEQLRDAGPGMSFSRSLPMSSKPRSPRSSSSCRWPGGARVACRTGLHLPWR